MADTRRAAGCSSSGPLGSLWSSERVCRTYRNGLGERDCSTVSATSGGSGWRDGSATLLRIQRTISPDHPTLHALYATLQRSSTDFGAPRRRENGYTRLRLRETSWSLVGPWTNRVAPV